MRMTEQFEPHQHPHYESALMIRALQEEVAQLGRDISHLQSLIAMYLDADSDDEQESALSMLDQIVPLRRR